MSKIKDLYAIEEGIDDLMPVQKPDYKYVAEQAVKHITAKSEDFRNYLWENMEVATDYDDEGHESPCFENFWDLCGREAEDAVEQVIEDQEIDLSDHDYKQAVDKAHAIIGDAYADLESELLKEYIDAAQEERWRDQDYYNAVYDKNKH